MANTTNTAASDVEVPPPPEFFVRKPFVQLNLITASLSRANMPTPNTFGALTLVFTSVDGRTYTPSGGMITMPKADADTLIANNSYFSKATYTVM